MKLSPRLARFLLGLVWRPRLSKLVRTQICRDPAEKRACYRLLHDVYVGLGYMSPEPSGMRALPQYAMMSSATITAMRGAKICGTVTVVGENPLGLPMERVFSLKAYYQKPSTVVCEFSGLCVAPRERGSEVIFCLLQRAFKHARETMGATHIAIAVSPDHVGFYTRIFGFEMISTRPVADRAYVGGKTAYGLILDVSQAVSRAKAGASALDRRLASFFL